MTKIPITTPRRRPAARPSCTELKTVERPEVITAIAEARAQGDITENAEYEAARERQGFIEGRIIELEAKLANAQVIDPSCWRTTAAWCSAPRWSSRRLPAASR